MADKFKSCSIDGCNGNSHHTKRGGKGFCNKHYKRLLRHGDPKLGRTYEGEPREYYLNVVLPYEGEECILWPYGNVNGYGRLSVDGKDVLVTRLICAEVNGPPPTPDHEAAHSCGNGHLGCVTKSHLRWSTHKENMEDTVTHGISRQGERSNLTKITETQARKIKAMKGKMTMREIAYHVGTTLSTVAHIHRGASWSWLDQPS